MVHRAGAAEAVHSGNELFARPLDFRLAIFDCRLIKHCFIQRDAAEQLSEALKGYHEIGVEHIALQFMVPRYPERMEQIERFACEVMPAFQTK